MCALTAKTLGWKVTPVPADWSLGKKAGPLRNQRMIDMKPDKLLRFPGGRGTADCERRARAAGIEVVMVEEQPVVTPDSKRLASEFIATLEREE